ncbi:DUF1427 family protein [Streptomyces broussonetiae]|uniref:DUF1427 family protein n=1 Tax=Streptomyces broussonetiae TaxID=2686304 RepID=A0A6I6NJ69_9ACTN|nr:DUF1427 family protein [Streptomyces broussonetiae]
MLSYAQALGAGIGIGIMYALIRVPSPAPPRDCSASSSANPEDACYSPGCAADPAPAARRRCSPGGSGGIPSSPSATHCGTPTTTSRRSPATRMSSPGPV